MDDLSRARRRSPLSWLSNRITVEEILAADDRTAPPPLDPRQPHLGLTTGPLADRRTTRLPAPPPVRRIRPADLEASSSGLALYGPRIQVPWPYRDLNAVGNRDAGSVGEVTRYDCPPERAAARARVIVNRSATAGALVVNVCLARAGVDNVLRQLTNVDYESATPVTLVPGDTIRIHIITAGTAGVTVTGLISVEERA